MISTCEQTARDNKTERISTLELELSLFLDWLSHQAVPYWANHGLLPNGGVIESFDAQAAPMLNKPCRVLVQHRQIAVFALAYKQGWLPQAPQLIHGIREFLDTFATVEASPDPACLPRYAHSVSADGMVLDPQVNLYDLAFQLLAYGCCHHAFGDDYFLRMSEALYQRLDAELKSNHGGWYENPYDHRVRRQNPHMHLLEAFLVLFQTSADIAWLDRATEVVSLFESHFYQYQPRCVLEYFESDWSLPRIDLQIAEPGHMFEWVWLLRFYQSLTGMDLNALCDNLHQQANQFGIGAHGCPVDSVSTTWQANASSARLWPATERVKSSLSQLSFSQQPAQEMVATALDAIKSLSHSFISHADSALHIDQINADGGTLNANAPASTVYHLMMCGLEAQRYLKGLAHIMQFGKDDPRGRL